MDAQLATVAGTVLVAFLGCVGTWIVAKTKGRTDAQTTINSGFQFLIDQLQEERTAFAADILRLHEVLNTTNRDIETLNRKIRRLTLHIYSLERLLRQNNIEFQPINGELNGGH